MTLRAVIGLGANLGDRLESLRAAARAISRVTKIERLSRVYETDPVGGPPQPAFLNAAALVIYEGSAEELLDALQGIEAQLGRVREERWGPRAIDLDVLWIENFATETERLVVPHARLTERGFALRPLVDVAPLAVDPETGHPYARLVAAADPAVRVTPYEIWGAS